MEVKYAHLRELWWIVICGDSCRGDYAGPVRGKLDNFVGPHGWSRCRYAAESVGNLSSSE
jgi:hypothetical protein